jgi:valyl-tRNA synthetase
MRAEMKVDQKKKVAADFSSKDAAARQLIATNLDAFTRLGALSAVHVSGDALSSEGAAVRSTSKFDLRIAYGEAMDKAAEIPKLQKEIERLSKDIETKKARLADESFTSKAPAKVIEDFKATLAGREVEHQKLVERLKQLQ